MGGNEEILSNGLRDFSYMQTIEKVDFVSVGLRVRLMKYHDRIRHAGDVMEAIIHNNQNKEYKSQDVEKLKQVFDLLLDENDSSSVSSIRRDLFGYINNLSISYVETYGSWDD